MDNQIINLSKTIDSREVSVMMGKEHKQLLREIRDISGVLKKEGEKFSPSDYFIKDIYTLDGSKKEYVKYDCTKMGCELLGNKLQGEKGILFTAAYVKVFNAMEISLQECIPEKKTYSYMIEDPIKRAETWIEEQKEKQALEVKTQEQAEAIKVLVPKAKFADAVSDTENCILVREMAKILKQNKINIGEKKLYDILKSKKLIIRDAGSADYNTPTQLGMNLELFRIKTTVIGANPDKSFVNKTTKITPHGQQYILNKFLNKEWTV